MRLCSYAVVTAKLQNCKTAKQKKLPALSGAAFLFIRLFCYWLGVISLFRLSSLAGIGQIYPMLDDGIARTVPIAPPSFAGKARLSL
jgi:hypothetical protein